MKPSPKDYEDAEREFLAAYLKAIRPRGYPAKIPCLEVLEAPKELKPRAGLVASELQAAETIF